MSKDIDLNTATPEDVYLYARDVIKRRFPEGEEIITKDAHYSFWYADNAVKGRFPEGELAISKDPSYSYWYARDVLRGRFPEGEVSILEGLFADDYFIKIFLPNVHTVDKSNPTKAELKFLSMMI